MKIWRGRFPILNHKYRTGKSIRLIIQIARRMFVQISVNDYRAKKYIVECKEVVSNQRSCGKPEKLTSRSNEALEC